MFRSLGKYSDNVPLILRIGLGTTMLFSHGLPKMAPDRWEGTGRAMAALGITFAPAFWGFMAAITETVGGLFLLLGLWVRPTCAVLIFVLFVAAARNLINGSLAGGQAHPIDAAVGLIALMILGAGKYSLGKKMGID
jgi:putative oxidoreductase